MCLFIHPRCMNYHPCGHRPYSTIISIEECQVFIDHQRGALRTPYQPVQHEAVTAPAQAAIPQGSLYTRVSYTHQSNGGSSGWQSSPPRQCCARWENVYDRWLCNRCQDDKRRRRSFAPSPPDALPDTTDRTRVETAAEHPSHIEARSLSLSASAEGNRADINAKWTTLLDNVHWREAHG